MVLKNNNNLFLRNRSGTALGHSGLFSAALLLIILIKIVKFSVIYCKLFLQIDVTISICTAIDSKLSRRPDNKQLTEENLHYPSFLY